MPTFVVECYWPGITEEQVRHALALIGRARNEGETAEPVSRLGCILLPADGMAIFLFRAPSAPRLAETAQQAGLPFDRIVESIQELRLAAVERRIDADLACGRHRELGGELESLVARYPLRERFWAQLMLALYRSGRQGEALGAFERAQSGPGELEVDPHRSTPPAHGGGHRDQAVFPLDGDLASARALVPRRRAIAAMAVQAGCTDCLQVAQAFAAQLAPLGIKVRVKAMHDTSTAAVARAPADLVESTTSVPYPDGVSLLSAMLARDIPVRGCRPAFGHGPLTSPPQAVPAGMRPR